MSKVKEKIKSRDSITLKLHEEKLSNVNNIVKSMTSFVLRHLHLESPDQQGRQENKSPIPRNQWTRMLLLNLFDACAMSYRASAGTCMDHLKIANTKIAGQPCEGFYTGSMAEGVGCASEGDFSDTDIMNVLKNFKAVYQNKEDNTENDGTFEKAKQLSADASSEVSEGPLYIELSRGSHPGYTKLTKSESTNELLKITSALNYGPVIRSSEVEQLLAHEFEFDNAIAVLCESWPNEAFPWQSRHRLSGWPGNGLVDECSKVPCYIVSKAHACNADDAFEWRFSFARQESILFRSIPLKVKMVYILSKLLVKGLRIAEKSLSTYQLKSMFLWHCEQKTEEEFYARELEVNVEEFLVFITQNLDEHKLQNYFIQANNMISHISSDVVKDVKQSIESILPNFMSISSSIQPSKTYPFSVQCIARALERGSESESMIIQRIQSNFLHAIAEQILTSYLPFSTCIWMFTPYIPSLDSSCRTLQEETVQCLHLIQLLQKHSSTVFDVYGLPFVKLVILYCVIQVERSSDAMPVFRKLLESIFALIKDVNVSYSLADVFCLLGMKKGSAATRTCCYLISEWSIKNKTGGDIMMHTFQKSMTAISLVERGVHSKILLSRLNEMAILLDVSPSQIEVGMATILRLKHGASTVETLETFCSLRKDVTLHGALKQLVYSTFLFLAERESSVPNESENSLKALEALFDSNIYSTAAATVNFVTSVVVYQRLSNGETNTVQQFLNLVQTSNSCPGLKELESDIADLLSTPELDASNAFQFVLYYTRLCMVSTSTGFVLGVLDELVPPHINLGILSASGIELTSTEEIDLAIDCLEIWIHRSVEANVVQNKALPVKVYGKLGHLYHVKSQSTTDKSRIRRYKNKAIICFQTALKEELLDMSVIGDYLLFCKADIAEFNTFLDIACSSKDVYQISTYFSSSIPALNPFRDLQIEIEANGNIMLCSSVFIHYLAFEAGGCSTENKKERVREMKNITEQLTEILHIQEETQSDVETQRSILSDSLRIVGYCAAKATMEDEMSYALSEAKSVSPGRCISVRFTALFKELKSKGPKVKRKETLYSRV